MRGSFRDHHARVSLARQFGHWTVVREEQRGEGCYAALQSAAS